MNITRRQTLLISVSAAAYWAMPAYARRLGSELDLEARTVEFTGGAEVVDGDGVTLSAPEIAENGNTVPIEVSAPGASAIIVMALGNPNPGVVKAAFGPLSASQTVSTRIRLAGTQDVVAIAQMADGSFVRATASVKVTIGGCGG